MAKKAARKSAEPMQEPSFEDAIAELESLTRQLESGELSLDHSIKAYEKGMQLKKICQQMLDKAEGRLEYLAKQEDGSLETHPIAMAESEIHQTDQSRLFQDQ